MPWCCGDAGEALLLSREQAQHPQSMDVLGMPLPEQTPAAGFPLHGQGSSCPWLVYVCSRSSHLHHHPWEQGQHRAQVQRQCEARVPAEL